MVIHIPNWQEKNQAEYIYEKHEVKHEGFCVQN